MERARSPESSFRHAVVDGASMAGLLAARVLSDHFEQVTLVERDRRPEGLQARKGVPQARHPHVLLLRGCDILERLFPGLTDELLAAGALRLQGGRDLAWHHAGGWRTPPPPDMFLLAVSRPLLEAHVAERVRTIPNIVVLEGARAEGVATDADGRVDGILIHDGEQTRRLPADLIIDATGRGSSAPEWFKQLGYGSVPTEQIPARVTYSTCIFPEAAQGPNWRALIVTSPQDRKTAFSFPIEGAQRLVTLTSFFDAPIPKDHEAYLAFARALPIPDLYESIRAAKPLSGIVHHGFPGSQRRHFERLKSVPQGVLVIGDAISSFNPVYGQGMTIAALEAEALRRLIAEARQDGQITPELGPRWFRRAARIVDDAWQAVSIEDFQLPELASQSPLSLRPLQWYMGRVHRATHRSPAVTAQFLRVLNFLDPPTALMRPRIVAEVLLGGALHARAHPPAMTATPGS